MKKIAGMRFRKLRIAWSVAWGMVALLLCVMWVRSFSFFDFCEVPTSGHSSLHLQSVHGRVASFVLTDYHELRIGGVPTPGMTLAGELTQPMIGTNIPGGISLSVPPYDSSRIYVTPFWLVALTGCILAAIVGGFPWLPWWSTRFSLRTLLIATTLVAVVLGLIVWLDRR
jgi:hypothetical protein